VIVVNAPTTVINNFTLVDVNTNITFNRPAATTGTGDVDAPPLPEVTTGSTPSRSSTTAAPQQPKSLGDVVGTYGNLHVGLSGDCGGLTSNDDEDTFQVTVADPNAGVVTISSQGGTFTGTLARDYGFEFRDPESGIVLSGRFTREGGRVRMAASEDIERCHVSFSADKI
jgi:hypothetical protein